MTSEQQWRFLNEQKLKYGMSQPWEIRLREIATDVVDDEHAYDGNGLVMPFRAPGGWFKDHEKWVQSPYKDVRFRLISEVRNDRDIAQLIAEQIIRREILW